MAAVDTGDVAFEVRDISVTTAEGKTLLRGVDFALPGKSLLAVVGPSGAGKSTLLCALTGSRPAAFMLMVIAAALVTTTALLLCRLDPIRARR